jgi:hypothetical protein
MVWTIEDEEEDICEQCGTDAPETEEEFEEEGWTLIASRQLCKMCARERLGQINLFAGFGA